MDLHPDSTLPEKIRGNFVLLRAGTLRLVFSQQEVGDAEYLEAKLTSVDGLGILADPGHQGRQFAALSSKMTLLAECPADRFVVAPLREGQAGGELGWCWNEVQVLIDVELQPRKLPAVLCAPHTPVDHYVNHGGETAYLCSAGRLRAYAFAARS